ncbi:MAG: bifunctional nuclease family protein [Anaerolineae bacterium]|nr:bifunctional nuclease family protein [Anaerolineae bacterium]
MIEVIIDSIRVSLMSQHRVVVLKDINNERYLPIWIGPCEAEAITVKLQEMPTPRPLTHDLIKSVIREMGGRVAHILISELRQDVFYARVVIELGGEQVEVDSRPSDAIALAVRVNVPIFVSESVMDKAAREPDEDIERQVTEVTDTELDRTEGKVEEGRLSAFADFVDTLDLDDLDDSDE